jgi:hypothetical protein
MVLKIELTTSRSASILVLILAILIAILVPYNYFTNIEPKYPAYQAIDLLNKARSETTLAGKQNYIKEAIGVYGKGPSQKGLEMLSKLNSTEEIDFFSESVITDLNSELKAKLDTPKNWILCGSVALLIILCLIGTFSNYENWDSETRHWYIGLICCFLWGVLIGLL